MTHGSFQDAEIGAAERLPRVEDQMKLFDRTPALSATDLANHLSCRHLTALDLLLAKGEIAAPSWDNPHLRVLQQRGLEHERAYIESLRTKGLSVRCGTQDG
jgi:hypothetical protein